MYGRSNAHSQGLHQLTGLRLLGATCLPAAIGSIRKQLPGMPGPSSVLLQQDARSCCEEEVDQLQSEPILSVLPRFMHLTAKQVQGRAISNVLELLSLELTQPGLASESAIVRFYELIFVYAIRAYANSGVLPNGSWLAAMADPQLSRAVGAMHGRLEYPWALSALAKEAAMSRSAFAARFKQVVGQSPLSYLTGWRMQRARQLIKHEGRTLQQAALAVGYDSPSAFSRVFKRTIGFSPSELRRR